LMAPPTACVFAPRCAEAKPVCTQHRPPNVGTIAHMRRCILTDDDIAKMVAAVPAVVAERAQVKDDVVLSASHVTRVFQTRTSLFAAKHEIRAVDNVSLDIHRGETLALVGESGSGTSTLSKILLGLDAPTTGSVLLAGEPVTQMQPAKRAGLVQPIFQDPYSSLNPRRTLAEIIARPLVLRGEKSSADNLKSAREMLDMVRLPARLLYSYPSQLSGGQRQRVAIARALITSPKMLICDEPTSALDVSVQAQILTLLGDLQRNLHLTCVIITHDMAVVHQIADRVAVMLSGQIVELGTAHDVFGSPSNSYTKSLLAAAPQFKQDTVLA
jgi:peptide/nickel transport system ATP-binding protein